MWTVLFVALALRLWSAEATSLWLDDFHSLHHARADSWQEFFGVLRTDNHPPLYFALLRVTRWMLGESPVALRAPSIAIGILSVGLLYSFARRHANPSVAFAAAFLLATSSLHLEASAGVRMYALLALCVLGVMIAMIEHLDHGRGAWYIALWTTLGLHTHYHFLHAMVVLATVALAVATFHAPYRPRRRALVGALAIAGLLALPWYAWGFRAQLQHELAPGGSDVSLIKLAESIVHLVFHDVALHGETLRALFLGGAVIVVGASIAGAWVVIRQVRQPRQEGRHGAGSPAYSALLIAAAFGLPVWTALVAVLSTRAGFDWRYLVGATAPFTLLAAHGALSSGSRSLGTRRAALALAALAALLLAALNAHHAGHEDYRGAIAAALGDVEPGTAVIAADRQPILFPHSIGWSYYAPRLAPSTQPLPQLLAYSNEFALEAPESLAGLTKVHCILRSIRHQAAMLRSLRTEFPHEATRSFGRGVHLVTFSR